MINKIIAVIISISAVAVACFLLFFQYFQQDEWHGFGLILSQGAQYITLDKSLPELLLGDRVGARVITFSLFNIFHLNPFPYGLVALSLHAANIFLVFVLARKISNKLSIGLLSALFFLINEVGSEAYSWFGTVNGSATSVLFFLISLHLFLKFIDTSKNRFVLTSAFTLWLSFLFKEISAFAFILYPIIFFTYIPRKNMIIKFAKSYSPFLFIAIVFLLYFTKTVLFIQGDQANYVNSKNSFISTVINHSLRYPFEGVIQTFIPNSFLFTLSPITTRIIGLGIPVDSLEFLVASQSEYAELTTILLLIAVGGIVIFVLKKKWTKIPITSKRTLLISFSLMILSFTPYIVLNRTFAYLDSRHYYMAAIGASIFLSTFLFTIYGLTKNKKIQRLVILTTILYLIMHGSTLFMDFKLLEERSYERQLFLKQIERLVPELHQKTVFYITGNHAGYYGLPELKTPFQSGLGHVLMTVYVTKGQLSPDFFKEETLIKAYDFGFLYDILGQGYREINGQGFGYYIDSKELQKAIDKKLFTRENIISLYYESENKKLTYNNDFK